MIKLYKGALLVSAVILFSIKSIAQQATANVLPKGNYIVVAAYFAKHENFAKQYSAKLNEGGLHSSYGLDPTGKLYFVYLDQYADFTQSVQEMLKVRKGGSFDQAWVRVVKEGSEGTASVAMEKEVEPVRVEPKREEPKKEEPKKVVQEQVAAAPVKQVEPVKEEVKKEIPVVTEVVENPPAKPVYVPQTLNNTPVFISLYNSTNSQVLDGEVEVVDTERSKLITRVKGNTYLNLPNPGTKSGQLSLIANAFGYRKEQHEINYKNTEADTTKPYISLVGNYYMVNFGLSRIHKGDISTLYNVYFYNDAAIMLPESKYQLNSLLGMLNENPKLKIILHGHTNGNGRGKIIYMGPSKDFFTITKDVKEGTGSAKELSEARAHTIREWLLSQGISNDRVTVKGWGGARMIHDKNSVHARKNIRVDVEVEDE
ncbi:MAG: OmpA family protein [Bacteroidetes bacterium]|nr:OmpA family protein [Bacteroidota bacterium]